MWWRVRENCDYIRFTCTTYISNRSNLGAWSDRLITMRRVVSLGLQALRMMWVYYVHTYYYNIHTFIYIYMLYIIINVYRDEGYYYYYYRYLLRATCFLVLRLPCYKNDCTPRFFFLIFHFSLVSSSSGHSHVYNIIL